MANEKEILELKNLLLLANDNALQNQACMDIVIEELCNIKTIVAEIPTNNKKSYYDNEMAVIKNKIDKKLAELKTKNNLKLKTIII